MYGKGIYSSSVCHFVAVICIFIGSLRLCDCTELTFIVSYVCSDFSKDLHIACLLIAISQGFGICHYLGADKAYVPVPGLLSKQRAKVARDRDFPASAGKRIITADSRGDLSFLETSAELRLGKSGKPETVQLARSAHPGYRPNYPRATTFAVVRSMYRIFSACKDAGLASFIAGFVIFGW